MTTIASPPTRAQRVLTLIAAQAAIDESLVTPDTELAALGIHSLDKTELQIALEDKLGMDGPDAEWEDVGTVQQVVDFVNKWTGQGWGN